MPNEPEVSAPGRPTCSRPAQRGTLSAVLTGFARDTSRPGVAVAEILETMQDRALAALMFVFALPNVVPMPPGTSLVLGVPLVLLTAQLALGRAAWLPRSLLQRRIPRPVFLKVEKYLLPWLVRVERLLRPRLGLLVSAPAERVVGLLCFCLTWLLFLPWPLSTMPPSLAICLFALGIIERDGYLVVAGFAFACLAVALAWGSLYAVLKSALFLLLHAGI